jgi:aminoglycoside N3'-acetyltransferase
MIAKAFRDEKGRIWTDWPPFSLVSWGLRKSKLLRGDLSPSSGEDGEEFQREKTR